MELVKKYEKIIADNYIYVIFVISLFGVVGSLYASEVRELTPCVLCWYQRILLYPLLIISVVSIFLQEKKAVYYILPFSLLGMPIAFYQYLLQKTDIFDSLGGTCGGTGIACNTIYVDILGFITIPLLSFAAFSIVVILSYIRIRHLKKN